jgi:hypothetical protein
MSAVQTLIKQLIDGPAVNWPVVSTDPVPGCVANFYNRVVVYVTM